MSVKTDILLSVRTFGSTFEVYNTEMQFYVYMTVKKLFVIQATEGHSDDITKLLNCCNHANSNLRLNKLAVSVTTLVISVYLSDFEIKSFSKLYFTYRQTTAVLNLGYSHPWGYTSSLQGVRRI